MYFPLSSPFFVYHTYKICTVYVIYAIENGLMLLTFPAGFLGLFQLFQYKRAYSMSYGTDFQSIDVGKLENIGGFLKCKQSHLFIINLINNIFVQNVTFASLTTNEEEYQVCQNEIKAQLIVFWKSVICMKYNSCQLLTHIYLASTPRVIWRVV